MTGRAKVTATAMLAAALAGGIAPASAQAIPDGQSCGGLLCDMGVLGHKSEPPPAASPAAAPTPPPVAEAVPASAPAARARPPRPRKNVAIARTARPSVAAPRQASRPAAPAPEPAKPPAPVIAKAPAQAMAPRAAVARPTIIAPPTAPATAMQMPAPRRPVFYFKSVDPTLQ